MSKRSNSSASGLSILGNYNIGTLTLEQREDKVKKYWDKKKRRKS